LTIDATVFLLFRLYPSSPLASDKSPVDCNTAQPGFVCAPLLRSATHPPTLPPASHTVSSRSHHTSTTTTTTSLRTAYPSLFGGSHLHKPLRQNLSTSFTQGLLSTTFLSSSHMHVYSRILGKVWMCVCVCLSTIYPDPRILCVVIVRGTHVWSHQSSFSSFNHSPTTHWPPLPPPLFTLTWAQTFLAHSPPPSLQRGLFTSPRSASLVLTLVDELRKLIRLHHYHRIPPP
ncbi:Uncharacterized protein FWK35_00016255, partial [Aphis craccivora]